MSGTINALFGGQPENLDYIGYTDCPLCGDDCAELWRDKTDGKEYTRCPFIGCEGWGKLVERGTVKVYVVNVNNCEAYSDYYEGNVGVYATRKAALDAMRAAGFDVRTRRRKVPWFDGNPNWEEEGFYSQEEYRIEEWKVEE